MHILCVSTIILFLCSVGHDCCERVKVLLFASKKGLSAIVAQENFEFIKDEAYESAQFLASSVGNQQALLFAKFFLNKSRSSPRDAAILDKKITLAFRHLQLPSGWNILGESPSITGNVHCKMISLIKRCYNRKCIINKTV